MNKWIWWPDSADDIIGPRLCEIELEINPNDPQWDVYLYHDTQSSYWWPDGQRMRAKKIESFGTEEECLDYTLTHINTEYPFLNNHEPIINYCMNKKKLMRLEKRMNKLNELL
jgi:hypothetical protein